MNTMKAVMEVKGLAKEFVLHQQHGVVLNVLRGLDFTLMPGECLVLHGRSGAGTSTLLRTLYGNYLPSGGSIRIRHDGEMLALAGAAPRQTLATPPHPLGSVRPSFRALSPLPFPPVS